MRLLASLLLLGCGTSPDDRPVTIEVVTLEVLAPSCGQVQCHSSTTREQGYALDTVAGAKMLSRSDVDELSDAIYGFSEERMPPDSPLPPADLALFQAWVDQDAPGLTNP